VAAALLPAPVRQLSVVQPTSSMDRRKCEWKSGRGYGRGLLIHCKHLDPHEERKFERHPCGARPAGACAAALQPGAAGRDTRGAAR